MLDSFSAMLKVSSEVNVGELSFRLLIDIVAALVTEFTPSLIIRLREYEVFIS